MLKKILLTSFSIFLIIGIFYYLILEGSCSTQYLSDKAFSPDGEYFAQVQDNSCGGATGDYTTGVTITNAKSFFSNFDILAAQIINAKTDNAQGVFGSDGAGNAIRLTWSNKRTLKIFLSNCGDIIGENNSWKDIKIIYEGECSTNN